MLTGNATIGHLLTDNVCFLTVDITLWFCVGWPTLYVFYFTLFFITDDSFFLRISFGLLSTSWAEFCRDAIIVLWWDIELSFYFARIDNVHRGFNILFFYNIWISYPLTPVIVSSSLFQGSIRCFNLTSLTKERANFYGSKAKNDAFFIIYLAL